MLLPYDRARAVRYAHRWAYGRNPRFYDYQDLGGDCTNFASQCLYAGTGIMNFTPVYGWYYRSANEKAPAWTGVPFFKNFLLRTEPSPGDFVQLNFSSQEYGHTLVIVEVGPPGDLSQILVAAHSMDADWRPLSSYAFTGLRFLHILGARSVDETTSASLTALF